MTQEEERLELEILNMAQIMKKYPHNISANIIPSENILKNILDMFHADIDIEELSRRAKEVCEQYESEKDK